MPNIEELQEEHRRLCHAMQSGVQQETSLSSRSITPKHLRVGLNVTLCDQTAMVKLLVEKGIITEEELWIKLVEEMRLEVERFEERLTNQLGVNITLG